MRCLRGFCATSDPRRFDAEPLAVRSRSVIDVNRAARLFLTSLPWGHRMYETVQQNASADSVIDLRSDTVTKPSPERRRALFDDEVAMMAHFSGVVPRTVWAEDGILTWEHVASKLKGKSYHAAKTGLVSLENTHNMAGGTVTPPAVFDDVCDRAHEAGLPVHLDGARVFNAA